MVGVGIVEWVRLRDVGAGCAVIDEIAGAAYVQENGFLGRLRSTYAAEDCFCYGRIEGRGAVDDYVVRRAEFFDCAEFRECTVHDVYT